MAGVEDVYGSSREGVGSVGHTERRRAASGVILEGETEAAERPGVTRAYSR